MQISFILYHRIKLVFRAATKVETVTASEERSVQKQGVQIDMIPAYLTHQTKSVCVAV